MASHFLVGGYFERSSPTDPQMTLNNLRSKILHIYVTTTVNSFMFTVINVCVFETKRLFAGINTCGCSGLVNYVGTWIMLGSIYFYDLEMITNFAKENPRKNINEFTVPLTHTTFHSLFHSTASRFPDTEYFERSAQMSPKWLWTLKGQRYPICISQLPETPNSLYSHPVLTYMPFWDKYTEWLQNGLEY